MRRPLELDRLVWALPSSLSLYLPPPHLSHLNPYIFIDFLQKEKKEGGRNPCVRETLISCLLYLPVYTGFRTHNHQSILIGSLTGNQAHNLWGTGRCSTRAPRPGHLLAHLRGRFLRGRKELPVTLARGLAQNIFAAFSLSLSLPGLARSPKEEG